MTKHDNVSKGKIMKATEFVKWFGWNITKYNLKYHLNESEKLVYMDWILSVEDVDELKRLVESHEILGLFKSLDQAKADVAACEYAGHADLLVKLDCGIGYINTARVKQAIADVEACHEVN